MNFSIFTGKIKSMDEIKPFDVSDLEADIEHTLMQSRGGQIPQPGELEEIVRYAPHPAEQVSRLTAQAVMEQHEQAANAIKRLLETVGGLASEHERALQELDAMGKLITEAAEKYIALGEQRRELLTRSARIMADVKQTCADVMTKIDNGE